jgi:hypothetical protein
MATPHNTTTESDFQDEFFPKKWKEKGAALAK